MNKAFVREPDATHSYCPKCGSLGQPVYVETLAAMLSVEARGQVSEAACFCPFPTCEVAYFDTLERTVPVSALTRPVYPKDPEAPICPCFGVTCDDLDTDARAGVVERIRSLIEKSRSPEAHCRLTAPSGTPCVAEAQRFYLKCRNG